MASATQPTKNATRARFRPTAGRNRGSFGPGLTGGGSSGTIRPSRPGISFNSPIRSARSIKPDLLHQPHRGQQPPHPLGVGEQPEEDQLAEPVVFRFRPRSACSTARRNGSISRP